MTLLQQTKFGADGLEVADIFVFMHFQNGGRPPSWIRLPPFWMTHAVTWMGCVFPVSGAIIWSDMTQILQFCYFEVLGEKCLFSPVLPVLGILTPKLRHHCSNPKSMHFSETCIFKIEICIRHER